MLGEKKTASMWPLQQIALSKLMFSPHLLTMIPGCSLMSLSGWVATPIAVRSTGLVLLQLNAEGLTTAKLNVVQQIDTKKSEYCSVTGNTNR